MSVDARTGKVLTDREVEILVMAASGLTRPVIAERLSISEQTVKNHLTAIYAKLGVRGLVDAMNAMNWVHVNGEYRAGEFDHRLNLIRQQARQLIADLDLAIQEGNELTTDALEAAS